MPMQWNHSQTPLRFHSFTVLDVPMLVNCQTVDRVTLCVATRTPCLIRGVVLARKQHRVANTCMYHNGVLLGS
jgi:hypothetical protein